MKKIFFFIFLGSLITPAFSMEKISTIVTETNTHSGQYFQVHPQEEISLNIHFPAQSNTVFIHQIPKNLTSITNLSVSDNCKVLQKKKIPFLILCKNTKKDISLSYTGSFSKSLLRTSQLSRSFSGFTAGRYTNSEGVKIKFFERNRFQLIRETGKEKTEKPSVKAQEKKQADQKPQKNTQEESAFHSRIWDTPKSHIILGHSQDNIIASVKINPEIEPVDVEKLTVLITDIDTTALYGDIPDDYKMIDTVSLWYQDGTPIKEKNGPIARALSVDTNKKALFNNLQLTVPEGGEYYFIGINTHKMLNNKSGSSISANLSTDPDDYTIRGLWSNTQYNASDILFSQESSPNQYILANKIVAQESDNQPTTLLKGENELLRFETSVVGGKSLFIHKILVDIAKTSDLSGGFRVDQLRLRYNGNIIASIDGENLTGIQTLTVGQCAGDDICSANEGTRHEIFNTGTFLLEAHTITAGDTFSSKNALTGTIQINGSSPGEDGIIWEDYGSGEDDGITIKWIDNSPNQEGVYSIRNTISAS